MAYELFNRVETPTGTYDGWQNTKGEIAIFEYLIEYIDDETLETKADIIVGVSDDHAEEEASYECSAQVFNVTRQQFLYWQ